MMGFHRVRLYRNRRPSLRAWLPVRMLHAVFLLPGLLAISAPAATPGLDEAALAELDIESLLNIKVISAAKKEQTVSESAAAVYVITQDDIRRSGATSIPDALRMAPGLQVARQDASTWAISARGFNSRFANKLLVMIDGRTVYTPLFSGVYWDVQDLLLEDIERIEVIRGPGATLWGANAVNGVINIITKRAADTTGALVTGGVGTEEQGFGGVRFGDRLGDAGAYRVYFKYFNRDSLESVRGGDAADDWDQTRGGFRIDLGDGSPGALTLQGDIYQGTAGSTFTVPALSPPFTATADADTDVAGGNLLGRWTHELSSGSDIQLQFYYDRTERDSPFIREWRDTYDLDFQHHLGLGERHDVVWGLGYRYTTDDIKENSSSFQIDTHRQGYSLVNGFLQDEIMLIEERLRVTLGSKLEYNDYTGLEVQPAARFLWTPEKRQTVWGAVSRAVRTPSRAEDGFAIDSAALPPGALAAGAPPALVRLVGNSDYDSEDLLAYELGYRVMPTDRLSVDLAAFYNVYDNLRTLESGLPFPEPGLPPHLVLPLRADNLMDGETYGAELAVDYRLCDWWRLELAYTHLQMDLHLDSGSTDATSEQAEGQSPQNQVSLRSMIELPRNVEFDAWLRYVDNLPTLDVDSYLTLDLRLGWRPTRNTEVALVGQNLLGSQHQEFEPLVLGGVPSEVERAVYAKFTVRL
jgi:iron complex outermembrane receptor protein